MIKDALQRFATYRRWNSPTSEKRWCSYWC